MLLDRINQDYIQAMKNKEKEKASTLSFLRAQLKNAMIDKKTDALPDGEVLTIIKKQVKQRQDAMTQFRQGGRDDLAADEEAEMTILKAYLPQELSAEEIRPVIASAIQETAAAGPRDMGRVMKAVMPQLTGKADNSLVSQLVKEALNQL